MVRPDEPSNRLRDAVVRHKAILLVLLLCLGWVVALQHEMRANPPDLNDNVAHLSHSLAVSQAFPDLARASDPWELSPGMGYPNLHHYQNLPSYFLGALHTLLLGKAPMILLLRVTMVLFLASFPWVVYVSMRRFGMDVLPSALAAVCALLISDGYRQGWTFNSYVWSGQGMYSQLCGMLLLPLAVSWGYVFLKEGRGCFGAVAFLAATCLSHLLTGFVAVFSLFAILLVMDRKPGCWPARIKRWFLLFGLAGIVSSYYLVFFLRDGAYMNPSVWSHQEWFDSYGHQRVLQWLFTGQLLDSGRYVPLTLFAVVGLAVAIWNWKEERKRIAATLFVLWLALYCGRPTWGRLLDLIPFSREMHFNRYIMGVHLASLMLAGLGAAVIYGCVRRCVPRFKSLVAACALIALLVPAIIERCAYLKWNTALQEQTRQAFASERQDIDRLLATLRKLPPGRVFAGLPGMWGKDFRVGAVPIYAILQAEGFDCLGFMYLQFSLNADVQYLFDENSTLQYRLFNVTYVVADRNRPIPKFLKHLETIGRFAIYGAETGGYIDVVPSSAVFTGTKREWFPAARAWLYGPWFRCGDYPRIRLTDRPCSSGPSVPLLAAPKQLAVFSGEAAPAPGKVVRQQRTLNRADATVSMSRTGYVIFRSTYHPNWRVGVDGERKQPVMLMPSYLGVEVLPGQHTVAFTYEPSKLRPWLFAMGCGILIVIIVIEKRRAS